MKWKLISIHKRNSEAFFFFQTFFESTNHTIKVAGQNTITSVKIMRHIIALGALGWASLLHAYPNFVGYGYTSCLTCHYNPFGNGPLTDYGRALGATTIADNILYTDTPLDKVGERSGFLFSKASNTPQELSKAIKMKINLLKFLSPILLFDWK